MLELFQNGGRSAFCRLGCILNPQSCIGIRALKNTMYRSRLDLESEVMPYLGYRLKERFFICDSVLRQSPLVFGANA
jgi:hypothetical protein